MTETAKRSKNLLVTLVFVIFGPPGILIVYLPAWMTRWQMPPDAGFLWRGLGILLIVIGLVPLADSIARFIRKGRGTLSPTHPTESLVVTGLYRYVRNPMYLGVLALLGGQAALFRSRPLCSYLAWVAVGFHLFVMLYEEPTLRSRYGASYDEFCRNVPRWVPRLTPWRSGEAATS
jgi:protein-S-isoprenylcysteine O-methyltransferase Ste14